MRITILPNHEQADDGDYLSDMIYDIPPAETPHIINVRGGLRRPLHSNAIRTGTKRQSRRTKQE